jgi:CheY-like chemotaxis protein
MTPTSAATPPSLSPDATEASRTPEAGSAHEVATHHVAAQAIKALFHRHGVQPGQHSVKVAELLSISYSQAHRKASGVSAWSLEELKRVADHFGESLVDLLWFTERGDTLAATIAVGGLQFACLVKLGEPLPANRATGLVAIERDGTFSIRAASDMGSDPVRPVRRLVMHPPGAHAPLIAVLDDDTESTDNLCAHLTASGYQTRAFYTVAALRTALAQRRFDGYVLDWVVGEETSKDLISQIRAADAHTPILVLTGQMGSGRVNESAVATALATYGLIYFEKPVRLAIISAALSQALAKKQQTAS